MKRLGKLFLNSFGIAGAGFAAMCVAVLVLFIFDLIFHHAGAILVALLVGGVLVAVMKHLPECVERVAAIRERRKAKEIEERTTVQVLGFTVNQPKTRAMRIRDEK